ncbi:GxxExxY protein [Sorangium sp. So ce1097]|uniref:GxxExxY protein n=1 Tax=Sorangium sp. So ce1097 TaxID=3133330 RepID=UPI003F615794
MQGTHHEAAAPRRELASLSESLAHRERWARLSHVAQLLSYLKAARLRLGLVLTFNVSFLRTGVRRVVQSP